MKRHLKRYPQTSAETHVIGLNAPLSCRRQKLDWRLTSVFRGKMTGYPAKPLQ